MHQMIILSFDVTQIVASIFIPEDTWDIDPNDPLCHNGVSRRIYSSMEKRGDVASRKFVHLGGCPPLKTWVVGRCEKVFAPKMEGATKKRFVKRCRRKMRIGRCFFCFVCGIFRCEPRFWRNCRSEDVCLLVVLQLRRLWEDVFL